MFKKNKQVKTQLIFFKNLTNKQSGNASSICGYVITPNKYPTIKLQMVKVTLNIYIIYSATYFFMHPRGDLNSKYQDENLM